MKEIIMEKRKPLKLYLLTQSQVSGYDTYDSCIVAAENTEEAKQMHPSGPKARWGSYSWASDPELVECEEIGCATHGVKRGVVLASFKAG